MTRLLRKRLSLLISALLMAFVFCQGMAQAAAIGTALPVEMKAGTLSCHEQGTDTAQATPACASDCQHLDKAADSAGPQFPAPDHAPLLIAFLLPPRAAPTALQLAVASPPDPTSDPPPVLRFQRFRE